MLQSENALSKIQEKDLAKLQALRQPVVQLRRALEALGSCDGVIADATRLQEVRRRVEDLAAAGAIEYSAQTDMVRILRPNGLAASAPVRATLETGAVTKRVHPFVPRTDKVAYKTIRMFLEIVAWEQERGELPDEDFVPMLLDRLMRKYRGTRRAPKGRATVSNAIVTARSKGWLMSRSRGAYVITPRGRASVRSLRKLLKEGEK